MSTVGEQMAREKFAREQRSEDRKFMAKATALVLLAIAVGLGVLFGVIYLVVLAVRLAWGS